MSNRGNTFWSQRTAAATLMAGVVITMLGLGVALSLRAFVAGSVVGAIGVITAVGAALTYRM